ncbi:MAG: carboxypeptidase-like regulatory domain-containing protein [Bacteroidales bacterium]|nr:carboxypeptidase-like regulatory domain-containing protein [Bacteroidales bacterium]
MRPLFYIFSFLIIASQGLMAQEEEEDLLQFSGVIRNLKAEAIENVHCINIHKRTGTTSNQKGMFSFIVNPSDSILFSAVGYKNTLVVIPNKIEGQHYPRDVYMLNDTIQLAEVKIFPWKSYAEFKVAFINLELPDDDIQRANKNIALIKAQLNMDFEPDANLSYRNAMRQEYQNMYSIGQMPYYSVLNPLNWMKFFEALKEGDFKKKDKD